MGAAKKQLKKVPTASGGIARAAYTWALRGNLAVEPLLHRAGLTVPQMKNSRARIGVKNQIRFIDLVARELDDEFFGFRLAQKIDLRELGLLYYVLASSETLGDALRRAARYSTILNEGVHIKYRHGQFVSIVFDYFGVARLPDRHQIEFFVTILLRICRQLTRLQLMPSEVKLIHHRVQMPAEFRRLFGTHVAFSGGVDEIKYPGFIARTPITSADPYLNTLLVQYCEEAVASRRSKSSAWRLKVENAIVPLLPHGQARIGEISKHLGVSTRTLARRLASEGLTFVKVLDDLRFDLAKRYLQERELPISEIAWLLGYRESSALNHAFKRWTGAAPSRNKAMRRPLNSGSA